MPTTVYIDGFNLYYGCIRGTPYRWLDLEALCRKLLPKDDIVRIRYFTAKVSARPDNPNAPTEQATYLRALSTLPLVSLHFGHFLAHAVTLPVATPGPTGPKKVRVIRTEEKGSDVNLASLLLLDAFKSECDTAVVVSNDSDLREPVRIAKIELGLKVGVVNPHLPNHRSRELSEHADFFKQLRRSALKSCLLPETLTDETGTFSKPENW